MNKIELLAPAGNYESFLGAIHAGADAVYLGGDKFGARAFAGNFETEELLRAIRYAHLSSRKVYLTLNTLVKESEFFLLFDYMLPFYEEGLDGVIIQDMGVFHFIKEHFPELSLHVSTQMTITGTHGARFMKNAGASRIVPARELSLQEISDMKKGSGLEIETFIHGSMCYCYSGQCLFSSILGGRSGNRGRCAQPCRLPYEVLMDGKDITKTHYSLSLKDMCTIQFLPQLIEAGIDSFKIEGRMKKAEYAAGVTALYRKYIDRYYDNPNAHYEVAPEDMKQLESLYIRSEIQTGYYSKHNGAEMVTGDAPGYKGSEETILSTIRQIYIEVAPKKEVSVHAYFHQGEVAVVTLSYEDLSVSVQGQIVQPAIKQPVTAFKIEEQLGKLGNTVFTARKMKLDVQDDIFFSLKEINELRRRAVLELEGMILQRNAPEVMNRKVVPLKEAVCIPGAKIEKSSKLHILVTTKKQLEAILSSEVAFSRLYLDCDLCGNQEEWLFLLDHLRQQFHREAKSVEIIIAMPHVLRKRDNLFLNNFLPVLKDADGCLFRNLETLGYLQEQHYDKALCSDAGIYIWNLQSFAFWEKKITSFCLPYELNRKEQIPLLQGSISCEQVVYGYLPMMVTANCVVKTSVGCRYPQKQGDAVFTEQYHLKDRYQKNFPVFVNCKHCYNVIYNTVPLSLHSKVSKGKKETDYRLDFTQETTQETIEILEYFSGIMSGNMVMIPPYKEYTTGHEKRGVE